jgi:hypothetical protein
MRETEKLSPGDRIGYGITSAFVIGVGVAGCLVGAASADSLYTNWSNVDSTDDVSLELVLGSVLPTFLLALVPAGMFVTTMGLAAGVSAATGNSKYADYFGERNPAPSNWETRN